MIELMCNKNNLLLCNGGEVSFFWKVLTNRTIGIFIESPFQAAYWQDPDFDPKQRAFYYVRVIEIPTPHWTAYDAKFFKTKMPAGTKLTVQDRAYTSPIWYTP